LSAYPAIDDVGWRLEWQNSERPKHGLELRRELRRALLFSPVAQFRRNNDARADFILADRADFVGDASLRIADQIGNDVRIEAVAHQNSTPPGSGSRIGGNSSSIGVNLSRTR